MIRERILKVNNEQWRDVFFVPYSFVMLMSFFCVIFWYCRGLEGDLASFPSFSLSCVIYIIYIILTISRHLHHSHYLASFTSFSSFSLSCAIAFYMN